MNNKTEVCDGSIINKPPKPTYQQVIEDRYLKENKTPIPYEAGGAPDQSEEDGKRGMIEAGRSTDDFKIGRDGTPNGFNELKVEEDKNYISFGLDYLAKRCFLKEFDLNEDIELPPTTILSKAIEQVEQMGNYKVMVALVDGDKSKPKEERLYTFTDIESKKLRGVIYKEMEKDFE